MTEATTPHPEDSYGIAKHAVEQELRASRAMFGLDYIVFRPHNVYGPRQNIADRYRNVVGIFMNQILQGRPMTIFGDGTQTRAFSYYRRRGAGDRRVDRRSPGAWNEVFNVGADEPLSLNDLARRGGATRWASSRAVEHLPARPEVAHAHSSHEKSPDGVRRSKPQTPLAGRSATRWRSG